MGQTLAILIDAYRDLNSRKMFWITLILSGLVMAAFAIVSVNGEGIQIANLIKIPDIGRGTSQVFYKWVFSNVIIGYWLGWAAAILALISTAGIFPDFLSAGSIDLFLSKPISRLRLFATKFVSGLLFVGLQVTVFCVLGYFVVGWRGHMWLRGIFWAIPIVLCFFSYLYSICVLIGLLTRSTLAAILLTVLMWFVLFLVNQADQGFLFLQMNQSERMVMRDHTMQHLDTQIAHSETDTDKAMLQTRRAVEEQAYNDARSSFQTFNAWHRGFFVAKTMLPKTQETIALLNRILLTDTEAATVRAGRRRPPRGPETEAMQAQAKAVEELDDSLRHRPLSWVVGTSLIFEAILVILSAWIFVRRDY